MIIGTNSYIILSTYKTVELLCIVPLIVTLGILQVLCQLLYCTL